jgi:hypothetical protein
VAGPKAARARTPWPATAGRPARTDPPPGPAAPPAPPCQRAGSTSTLWPAATV